jgi:hypothetical protein
MSMPSYRTRPPLPPRARPAAQPRTIAPRRPTQRLRPRRRPARHSPDPARTGRRPRAAGPERTRRRLRAVEAVVAQRRNAAGGEQVAGPAGARIELRPGPEIGEKHRRALPGAFELGVGGIPQRLEGLGTRSWRAACRRWHPRPARPASPPATARRGHRWRPRRAWGTATRPVSPRRRSATWRRRAAAASAIRPCTKPEVSPASMPPCASMAWKAVQAAPASSIVAASTTPAPAAASATRPMPDSSCRITAGRAPAGGQSRPAARARR